VVRQLYISYSPGCIRFYNCDHQLGGDRMDNGCTTSN